MIQPNRQLIEMRDKVYRFQCPDCERHWSFHDLTHHKLNNKCRRDPRAENNISVLQKQIARAHNEMGASKHEPAKVAAIENSPKQEMSAQK